MSHSGLVQRIANPRPEQGLVGSNPTASAQSSLSLAMVVSFKSKVFRYQGSSPWHFLPIPKSKSKSIYALPRWKKASFGSIKVKAKIGNSRFETSIFPDTKTETYLLPLKKSVREVEDINSGDTVCAEVEINDDPFKSF